jgi:hypothetical protein
MANGHERQWAKWLADFAVGALTGVPTALFLLLGGCKSPQDVAGPRLRSLQPILHQPLRRVLRLRNRHNAPLLQFRPLNQILPQ